MHGAAVVAVGHVTKKLHGFTEIAQPIEYLVVDD